VPAGIKPPPSLRNIFNELQREGFAPPQNGGSLQAWAEQGVLLLNTCLTVEDGQPASHAKRGWEALTDAIIQACSDDTSPKVFLLWGAHAQAKRTLIDEQRHCVLTANHPSPLSAMRPPEPFIGCGHFGKAKGFLSPKNPSPLFQFPTI
jgi:uracil-DNA glycosylase